MLKPLTAWLPARVRRSLAIRGLQALATVPGGPLLVDFLGRMTPDPSIQSTIVGQVFQSPIGLGGGVDPDALAIGSLGRFGVGFVEVGPYHIGDARRTSILAAPLVSGAHPELLARRLSRRPAGIPVWLRLVVREDDPDAIRFIQDLLRSTQGIDVVCVSVFGADDRPAPGDPQFWRSFARAFADGADRIWLVDSFAIGTPVLEPALDAGASGIVFRFSDVSQLRSRPLLAQGWPWAALLGLGMLVAGAVVLWVGLTSVLLFYDEAFLGISRDALATVNPRLLGFMRHDRITLAGTMLSIGILYLSLAWNGLRRGWSWARDALLGSAIVGFATLFAFLGFHYVDPLHVTLSVCLFPLFVLGVVLPPRRRLHYSSDLDNDAGWRLGMTGQLYFLGLAVGLIGAGLTIMVVGATRVFVFADLDFLRSSPAALAAANAHLLPLIAHDRAGFGGALASDGLAVLLITLWGFRRGERWVWWTLLLAGFVGLASGIYAHVAVGYLEFGHLLPVFFSAVVFGIGLAFSAPFLLRGERARTEPIRVAQLSA
ncbi:MAG: hypothetical protein E6I56_01065 [Chloroflexi bacterium]|nr:MAG: hypothetical protein E6I56_01065 [Chloroflexota bacterium]